MPLLPVPAPALSLQRGMAVHLFPCKKPAEFPPDGRGLPR